MRVPWLVFAILLVCGVIAFSISADWSGETWLDLAAYAVSVIGIVGVLIYASGRTLSGAAFWRLFRWVFVAVVATHGVIHALQVAKLHNYSVGGTVGFVLLAAVAVGWIYLLQWTAMTRLAKGH